jgi:hypothetical protein
MRKWGPVVAAAALLALVATARAANVLSIGDVVVEAGATLVEIPIGLDVTQGLTRLRFHVRFDPDFCRVLDDPTEIEIVSDGRNLTDPEDTEHVCASGMLDVDVIDDEGAIDAGTGPILTLEIGDVRLDGRGTFTLTPTNIVARAGGGEVPIEGAGGRFTVTPVAPRPAEGCPTAPSFAGLGCRLDTLIGQVEAALGSGASRDRAFRKLLRARRAQEKAVHVCAEGRTRRAGTTLLRAARALAAFRRRLASSSGTRGLPEDVRAAFGSTADAIAADQRVLRDRLDCPASSPSGAFLDP